MSRIYHPLDGGINSQAIISKLRLLIMAWLLIPPSNGWYIRLICYLAHGWYGSICGLDTAIRSRQDARTSSTRPCHGTTNGWRERGGVLDLVMCRQAYTLRTAMARIPGISRSPIR